MNIVIENLKSFDEYSRITLEIEKLENELTPELLFQNVSRHREITTMLCDLYRELEIASESITKEFMFKVKDYVRLINKNKLK